MVDKKLYTIRRLIHRYTSNPKDDDVLRGIDLTIPAERLVCLSGPSGSGKTTLLNILGLIEEVQQGEVTFLGSDFSSLTGREKNHHRRHDIGFIFQHFHLFPTLTVEENVAFFLKRQGISSKQCRALVQEALEAVGLYELRHRRPRELSGGQQQRVAIARALAKRPRVILADEPTASLDRRTGEEIIKLLSKLVSVEKISVVLSSHDPMVMTYCDEQYELFEGMVESVSACEDVG